LLSPATQKLRLEFNSFTGGSSATGYGLGISKVEGFLGHTGAVLGYGSAMFYLPGSDATFVLIGNSSGDNVSSPSNIFLGLAYYLFPEQFPKGI
jgi:D-alanyl-D-alanine carboxypeptidase